MKYQEIELLLLELCDRVKEGDPIEDQRIELKGKPMEGKEYKYARQLAGLANALRGDDVIWVMGLDEKSGIVELGNFKIEEWWPKVRKYFSSASPTLDQTVVKKTEKGTILGLYFCTPNLPYLISTSGGQITREVPWRENNSTRSAYRDDLLRILVPRSRIHNCDPITAVVDITHNDSVQEMKFECNLYLSASTDSRIIIPYYKNGVIIRDNSTGDEFRIPLTMEKRKVNIINMNTSGSLIQHTITEVIVQGAGLIILEAIKKMVSRTMMDELRDHSLDAIIELIAIDVEEPIKTKITLTPTDVNTKHQIQWRYGRSPFGEPTPSRSWGA